MMQPACTIRRYGGALALWLALTALPAAAQESPRIGVLSFTTLTQDFRDAFTEGLRAEGYAEGRNIRIEWRSADGRAGQAAQAAAELVGLKVDVIVASLTPAVQAVHKATSSIPIVMAPAGDPVQQGFAASLARPGGNITGLTGIELSAKRVELLRELVPGLKKIALLLNSADPSFAGVMTRGTETGAKLFGIEVLAYPVKGVVEFDGAFAAMARERVGAVVIQPSLIPPSGAMARAAELAIKYRIPAMTQQAVFPDQGGLISYGIDFRQQYRRAAAYVARILKKGEKPETMPIEQATTFELIVNRKTADALGLAIPQSLLLRATRTVE
jgi:putative ABC transport system substrate-binding protein